MAKHLCIEQIGASLERLRQVHPFFGMSFLAFKKARLPKGRAKQVIFSQIAAAQLQAHYRISENDARFYNPYRSSKDGRGGAWVKPRYPSTTLQRITADTFSDVFLHVKNSSEWGFTNDYVERLRAHKEWEPLPAFDMAVWLFRDREWPASTEPADVRSAFFKEYDVSADERALFEDALPEPVRGWLVDHPVTVAELRKILRGDESVEDDESPERPGAALMSLRMVEVGPVKELLYEAAPRLNLITGDNALGKTFLLDGVYWSLTGNWPERPLYPRRGVKRDLSRIAPHIGTGTEGDRSQPREHVYSLDRGDWAVTERKQNAAGKRGARADRERERAVKEGKQNQRPGVVIFARHDGSFAVWDVAQGERHREINFDATKVWREFRADWMAWSGGGERFAARRNDLVACAAALSPDPESPLRFGEPYAVPGESSETPTLEMSYGEVPITLASAGIRRMLAIAYMLVWSWHRHLLASAERQEPPVSRVVLLVDEGEAHLHPRWQLRIAPALIRALDGVVSGANPQLHLATHSPLVMASAEEVFDAETDRLHHLRLADDHLSVVLEQLPFEKLGRIDRWLTSEVFGLLAARGVMAAKAIAEANALQRQQAPVSVGQVQEVHEKLARYLGAIDEYWIRWLSFAKRHGVER